MFWHHWSAMDTKAREASTVLPPAPTTPREARRFVTTTLAEWSTADDCAEIVELLTSELVTNAVLHAGTAIVVRVRHVGTSVRIEVVDSCAALPTARLYSDDAVTGRGLQLVETLAHAWGVEPGQGSKTLWFEITS
jgi:anti-sigma regulatory factor (Ser/Thr protein kinase)